MALWASLIQARSLLIRARSLPIQARSLLIQARSASKGIRVAGSHPTRTSLAHGSARLPAEAVPKPQPGKKSSAGERAASGWASGRTSWSPRCVDRLS